MATQHRRIVIAPDDGPGDGVLAMDDSGWVDWYASPAAAVAAIRKADTRATRTGFDAAVTTIQWDDMPEGFVPPTEP